MIKFNLLTWEHSDHKEKLYGHEKKIHHILFFEFLLVKDTFVTWQMGRKRLLARSNESPIFENQIKKFCFEKN
jgi:hypothetical protein